MNFKQNYSGSYDVTGFEAKDLPAIARLIRLSEEVKLATINDGIEAATKVEEAEDKSS